MSGSGFLSHSRSELSHGDEADTIGLDQHFLGGKKKKIKDLHVVESSISLCEI